MNFFSAGQDMNLEFVTKMDILWLVTGGGFLLGLLVMLFIWLSTRKK